VIFVSGRVTSSGRYPGFSTPENFALVTPDRHAVGPPTGWNTSVAVAEFPANSPAEAVPLTTTAASAPVVLNGITVLCPLFQAIVAVPLVLLLPHDPDPLPDALIEPDLIVLSPSVDTQPDKPPANE
jgi:hypothetical protein